MSDTTEVKPRIRNPFARKPRFVGNGEDARARRVELEPANIRMAGIDATSSRANIAG